MAENPADVVARWQKGSVAAVPKFKEKIKALQVNPAQKAIASKDKYVAGIMQSLEDGTWEAGLRGVDFQAWKDKTAEAGGTRISTGVATAGNKMLKFYEQFLPYAESVSRQVQSMPSSTFEDNVARMVANATLMKQFRKRS